MFKEGDILCSRYKLKGHFDGGGYSSVWLATDLIARTDFALKIYDDVESMEEFRRGYSLVVNFNHSNIFTPLSYEIHNGVPFLVMTYCPNGSAKSKIGKMDENEIWKFVHDVAAGLAYLHDRGIVHQDIKPGNILIDDDGKYMITDFDISTRQEGTRNMTARQVEAMQNYNYGSGTPNYMAAERWPDANGGYWPAATPYSASDIWSLGATLFELIEGHVPFGETGGAYQRGLCRDDNPRHRKGDAIPKMASNYSKELKKLVRMCLAKDTWNRPKAQQIAEAAVYHKAPPMPNPNPIPKWIKYLAAACIIIVMSCLAYFAWAKFKQIKEEETRKEQLMRDNNYSIIVNNATKIVREQASLIDDVKKKDYAAPHVGQLIEAAKLYQQAMRLDSISDSTRIAGEGRWQMAQELINIEYKHIQDWEKDYREMVKYGMEDAAKAADSMKVRLRELSPFTTTN